VKISAITKSNAVAKALMHHYLENKDEDLLEKLSKETSDRAREWACYLIGRNDKRNLKSKLNAIKSFADDAHFGVRESAWFSVRDHIVREPDLALTLLESWTKSNKPNLRRFASEATRPRGVWCAHLEVLKQNPEKGLIIIEPLKSDESKYVRDSVGNWLNDAGKTNEKWLRNICKRWSKESKTKETEYILRRAMRNLK
jgi:3-methyladenine DNA glycosylase AlkC